MQLSAADAALLSEIGGKSLLESHGHSAPLEIMQAYVNRSFHELACREELKNKRNIFWAVYYHHQPAGYFKIILDAAHPMISIQQTTKLERLYLLKEFYGHKLGHGLLQQAISISKEQGGKGMWLDVWKQNERAIHFYEKEGFETIAEGKFTLTETRSNPIWVMLKTY